MDHQPTSLIYTNTRTMVLSAAAVNSLNIVACSNGEYGLITTGYTTFDSLPNFPYIGGAPQVRSWNSPYCGSCWQLTYTDAHGISTSLNITAVDSGDQSHEGYNLSEEAMNYLTHGQARNLGRVPVAAVRVPDSGCDM
ncbi:Cerato-platanin [Chiua virens]|nr:Cerato-platanin [Chiua virens]